MARLTTRNRVLPTRMKFLAWDRQDAYPTEVEKAKWEVPALRWADLTDNSQNYGISLLNACKYGYDSQADQLRLTLLRSPRWPDPSTDIDRHQFTYAIYPHSGSWQAARTVHRDYELNLPLQVLMLETNKNDAAQALPVAKQFLNIPAENLVLMAFKQSEDSSSQWILRCYECQGEEAEFSLENSLELAVSNSVDLLERITPKSFRIEPWEIASSQLNK